MPVSSVATLHYTSVTVTGATILTIAATPSSVMRGICNAVASWLFSKASMIKYHSGEGVVRDIKKAAYWYEKSAEQGNKDAQYNLGCLYAMSDGENRDMVKAAYWWRKAGEQGVVSSQINLGTYYDAGVDTLKDDKKAFYWWEKAAKQGDADSQFNTGNNYYNGEGVEQNTSKAIEWLEKAARQGHKNAAKNLEIIKSRENFRKGREDLSKMLDNITPAADAEKEAKEAAAKKTQQKKKKK